MATRLEQQLRNAHLCQLWMGENDVDRADLIPYGATLTADGETIELGRKIARARESHRLGRLHPDAVLAYERLPHWSWAPVMRHRNPGAPKTAATVLPARANEWLRIHNGTDAEQIPHSAVLDVDGTPYGLGKALARIRKRYEAGQLTDEEIRAFEQLPGWRWTPPRQRPHGQRKRFAPR